MKTIKGLMGRVVTPLLWGVGEHLGVGEHVGVREHVEEVGEHVDSVEQANKGAHMRRRLDVGEHVETRTQVCHAMCLRELRACDQACVRVHTRVLVTRRA